MFESSSVTWKHLKCFLDGGGLGFVKKKLGGGRVATPRKCTIFYYCLFLNQCIFSFDGWRNFSHIYWGVLGASHKIHIPQNLKIVYEWRNPSTLSSPSGHITVPSLFVCTDLVNFSRCNIISSFFTSSGKTGRGGGDPQILYAFSLRWHNLKILFIDFGHKNN